MRKLRPKKLLELPQITVRKWLGWDLNPDSTGPEPKHLIQFPFKLAEGTIIRTGTDVV